MTARIAAGRFSPSQQGGKKGGRCRPCPEESVASSPNCQFAKLGTACFPADRAPARSPTEIFEVAARGDG